MVKIAIRLDDITPDMDWDKFRQVKDILNKYNVKPLIGVVPDNQDEKLHKNRVNPMFWQCVKELQEDGWSVAQHGYCHIYKTKSGGIFPLNHQSEFVGIPYDEQLEDISKGMSILKDNGIDVNIFMAPGHTYDNNTLKALKKAGFLYITDGYGSRPYIREGLKFLPISFHKGRSLKKKKGFTTFVYHTNEMSEAEIKKLESMLSDNRNRLINYSEYLEVDYYIKERTAYGNLVEYLKATIKYILVRL